MYIPCILLGNAVLTWFKSMRTLFGLAQEEEVRPGSETHDCQASVDFDQVQVPQGTLDDLHGHPPARQGGGPALPVEVEKEEEGGDDADADAASLASAHSSSQVPSGTQPSTSQASPSQACDRRPRSATSTSTGKRVDEAILKLAKWLNLNTGVQDRLASAVQESTNPCLAFCQWMGLEACKLSEELWTGFMHDSFQMMECYRQLQAQQPVTPPPPPPQPAQHPAVQLQQQQSGFMCPSSAPPVVSPPSFHQQMTDTQLWQPSADLQPHHGWPTFSMNLSGLNTSGLSSFFDQAVGQPSRPPMPGTISPINTTEGRPVNRTSSTSDILRTVNQAMDQDQE